MKGYNNMKKLIYSLALAASILTMNSCIGDLDTVSLNETSKSDVDAYHTLADYEMGLAYIYGSFSLVSQSDPGSSDIAVDDAGQSEFTRQMVVLQEMSADALKCTWGDSYITDTQNASWTSTGNAATIAVYSRGMVTVTRANEFLKRTEGVEMEGLAGLRAEARFLRAYAYWVLLDLYGNPPFALPENINGEAPSQIGRPALAAWLAGELEDLAGDNSDMPEVGSVPYPRATKGAAQALLARLYLNYEVYTEGAETKWQEARDAAEKVINMGYTPCPNYAELFMQDNSENPNATQEMIFAIAYDRDYTQSWGGTTHLVSGSLDDDASKAVAVALGFPEGTHVAPERWNGYHVPAEYVSQNFELSGVTWGGTGLGYDRATSDQRAFFCNTGCEEAFDNSTTKSGWRCWKFTHGRRHHYRCQGHELRQDSARPRRPVDAHVPRPGLHLEGTCLRTDAGRTPPHRPHPLRILHQHELLVALQGRHPRRRSGYRRLPHHLPVAAKRPDGEPQSETESGLLIDIWITI